MDKIFYAHSKEGEPPEKWQRLEEQPNHVAGMARVRGDVLWGGK